MTWTVKFTKPIPVFDSLWIARLFHVQPGRVLSTKMDGVTMVSGTHPGPLHEALLAAQRGELHQYRIDYEEAHGKPPLLSENDVSDYC